MKYLLAAAVMFGATACTTLENRRDLYSPDVELYPRAGTTTTTVTRQQQTAVETTTVGASAPRQQKQKRETAPEVRPVPAEPEESPALPPP